MNQTSCPDADNLQLLLDDHNGAAIDLLQHLEGCADCQQTLETLAAEPELWSDTAQGLADGARQEPALHQVLEQLKNEELGAVAADDLWFLKPADKPEVLGLLGHYEVQEVIGRGGMGVVLKAVDAALNRVVAIKVLSPFLAASANARRRFVREGRAAAAVTHDHIVTIFGVDDVDGLPFLVMQYIEGESLQERLDHGGPLPADEIVRIGRQIASGLAAAHAQGLIHRDIKPANILIDKGCLERVKITDFGLARMTDEAGLTHNGVVTGTPEYMAPEQARGEPVDHRADLFSLGSLLYAFGTGASPFHGSSALGALRRVNDDVPPPLRSLNAKIPLWLEAIVSQLLAKDPAARIQSAAEVGRLLDQEEGGARPRQTGMSAPRRYILIALACLLAIAGTWITLMQLPLQQVEPSPAGHYYYDFRGSRPVPPELLLTGPEPRAVLTPEAEGLRVTLTENNPPDPVGVAATFRIKGNFEITVGYQILKAEQPKAGGGIGFELYIVTDTPTSEALGFYRSNRIKDGDGYLCSRMTSKGGARQIASKHFPETAKSGRLRLTRTGAEVTYWVALGDDDKFQELYRSELGPEDVKSIYLRAFNGRAPNEVDIRIKDFRIRADVADDLPVAAAPVVRGAPETRWRVWLMIAVATALCVGAALALTRTRRARRAPAPTEKSKRNKPARAEERVSAQPMAAAVASISLPCSGCGTKLKCKAVPARKRIKCPSCGAEMLIPPAKLVEG